MKPSIRPVKSSHCTAVHIGHTEQGGAVRSSPIEVAEPGMAHSQPDNLVLFKELGAHVSAAARLAISAKLLRILLASCRCLGVRYDIV